MIDNGPSAINHSTAPHLKLSSNQVLHSKKGSSTLENNIIFSHSLFPCNSIFYKEEIFYPLANCLYKHGK